MTRGQAPVLDPGLEPDELLRLIDDIAEIVERYNPDSDHPTSGEDALEADWTWREMHNELVRLLQGNGIPLDLS